MALLLTMMKKTSVTRIIFYLTEGVKADENKVKNRLYMESIESEIITENTYKPTVTEMLANLISKLAEGLGLMPRGVPDGVYLEGDIEDTISKKSPPNSTREVNIYSK